MLGDKNVHAVIAVKDLDAAKKFYGETLGLKMADENPGGVKCVSGNREVMIYKSEFAGTNQATAASWDVDDVEATVKELKDKGVSFEHYDSIPGVTRDGDVHVMGPMKAAWFKDPDGNILCVSNGAM
jgi:catechol 2,3-dioxygenase-like lactoylglutathione lyase family enzyme